MSDPAWDAYLKIMPTAAVVAVDRHGSVNLYDGPIFFSPTASRWCPINDSVKKVPVGLMPTTGDFSPEQAVKINPAIDPELQKRIQATIRGGPTADPVPSQWTGTIDNSAEMVKMQERFMKIINHVNTLIMDLSPDMGKKWQANLPARYL